MNLAQMFSLAHVKTGFSRQDAEVYAAADAAGFRVYSEVLNTFRGTFLKFDETSLTLTPGQTEYPLPADCTQIVHLAERATSTEDWHTMDPENLDDALTDIQNGVNWSSYSSMGYSGKSPFQFYGPYLDSAAAQAGQALQIQKIRVSPAVDRARFCQIAYTAKWLPITNAASKVMLPDEGTHCMFNWMVADLCGANDDTREQRFEAMGDKDLTIFLKWMRARQVQSALMIDSYGPGQ